MYMFCGCWLLDRQDTKAKVLILPQKMSFPIADLIGKASPTWGSSLGSVVGQQIKMIVQDGDCAEMKVRNVHQGNNLLARVRSKT